MVALAPLLDQEGVNRMHHGGGIVPEANAAGKPVDKQTGTR